MSTPQSALDARETHALSLLVPRALEDGEPLLFLVLFGSMARGDFDASSDVDVLCISDVPRSARGYAAAAMERIAQTVERDTGVELQPWVVSIQDLERGHRTPMLVDALNDGVALWPRHVALPQLVFTPEDARFCARCLLEWVDEGGAVTRAALREGRLLDAAGRARDDITRMATAALLLTGDTRHRRLSSLTRFEERFVAPREVSPKVLPVLQWAREAFPPDGGRGGERAPVMPAGAATAELGYRLASLMEAEVVPWIVQRL